MTSPRSIRSTRVGQPALPNIRIGRAKRGRGGQLIVDRKAVNLSTPEGVMALGNVMEVLFVVFGESIEAADEDKKYYLEKLKSYNAMGEALSGYLSELAEASRELGVARAGVQRSEVVLTPTPVTIRTFNLTTEKLVVLSAKRKRLDRSGLDDTIKEVESMQETVRNKRQMASTSFQNFDQKANQLFNMLSSVMKALNEMRMGTVRNML